MSANSPNRCSWLKPRHGAADDQSMETIDTPTRRRRDRGNTLPELLVAMVLMGFAVSAVIAGMRMTILASSTSDEQARVEAMLVSAADRLTATTYIPCPGAAFGNPYAFYLEGAVTSVGWQGDYIRIKSIDYWDASAGGVTAAGDFIEADGGWAPNNSFVAGVTCNQDINLTTSRTLQRIVLQATSPSGKFVRELEVIKTPLVSDPINTGTPVTP